MKIEQMGKAAVPFAVFAARWQEEVLIHKKASTKATIEGHIKNLLMPAFGKLAVGDIDSEPVKAFLNRLVGKLSAKTISNVWTDGAHHVEFRRCLEIRDRRAAR